MKKVQPVSSSVPSRIGRREYFAMQYFTAVVSRTNFSTQREAHVEMYNSYVYADDMIALSELSLEEIQNYLDL